MLRHPPALARIAAVAGMCHERLDGSGYPHAAQAAQIPAAARLLAAAEFYRMLVEERPG